MKTPEVSVIMPVYNAAAFVAKAVESVLSGHDGIELELIVGDNCSGDNTVDIVNRYATDPRLRVLTSGKNLGIFGNLNRLVEAARAPIVKILCADDYMLPGGIRRQLDFLRAHPRVGVARCWSQLEARPKRVKGPRNYEIKLPEVISPEASALAFFTFGNLPGNLTNIICRRDALREAGPFDQSYPYAGDFEMWARMTRKWALGLHREECVYVTEHEGQASVTLNRNNELIAQLDKILDSLYSRLSPEDKAVARWHASLSYGVYHASATLHRVKEGKWGAWKALFGNREHAFGGWSCLFLYGVTAGGRWGYGRTTRILLKRITEISNQESASN